MCDTQIGEIKKGLKTFKTCGVSDSDYQRHVMFVQVILLIPVVPTCCQCARRVSSSHVEGMGCEAHLHISRLATSKG